jgi:4-diphosphocytidyl-2-C-methyl-D-erythritol kinase
LRRLPATAKINLALVVGGRRPDGKHEVATVLQRVDLADRISLRSGERLAVHGFRDDTLVTRALTELAQAAGVAASWAVRIHKRIPVAAGLGGGSSDAATALRLANESLPKPLSGERLAALAASLGADVPFFLAQGPQLGEGDGSRLSPLDLPQDYYVVLLLPHRVDKPSTAAVYEEFERSGRGKGFGERRTALRATLAAVERPRDLAGLPRNDLASSPLADELRALGAFRADVSGAGPAVYGLFARRDAAEAARRAVDRLGRTWLTAPAWYG